MSQMTDQTPNGLDVAKTTKPPGSAAKREAGFVARMIVRIALTAILIVVLLFTHNFNHLVAVQQEIYAQGSRIEIEYRRRDNLMPRLTDIAHDYAQYEMELMCYVSDVRTLAKSCEKLKTALGPEKKDQVNRVIAKLIVIAEQYPDLKAEHSYQALMAKNVTTENRIAKERERYAALIGEYNSLIQTIPRIVSAHICGFEKIDQYAPQKDPMPERDKRFFFIY